MKSVSYQHPIVEKLYTSLNSSPSQKFIHVLIGPRQVGKSTSMRQLTQKYYPGKHMYVSADGDTIKRSDWLNKQWILAKQDPSISLLVVDEVQKIESWPEIVKMLWDQQHSDNRQIQLVLLGSSSLTIQVGLNESLAGRFMVHFMYHWSFLESKISFGLSFDHYCKYGGYPGSYNLISDRLKWLHYIKFSIVEPVIGKDILMQAHVKSPALFRQCFDILSFYPAQEISYTKLLGQLQDKGNTELVKHYLDLFEGAFLIKQLYKYSNKPILRRRSSPKILPLCPAIVSQVHDADLNRTDLGRVFELIVGAALNRLPGRLYYWRDGMAEVDYVYQFGKKLVAIEVKAGRKKSSKGLLAFSKRFQPSDSFIITPENFEEILGKI